MHDTEDRKHVDGRKTTLQHSCENGHESTVEVEADVHVQTNDWYTTLYITCHKGHDSTAQLLLKNGADVILQDSSFYCYLQ